jgi:hypothetical protein
MIKILKGGGGESTDDGLRENFGFCENNVQRVRAPPPQASPVANKSWNGSGWKQCEVKPVRTLAMGSLAKERLG